MSFVSHTQWIIVIAPCPHINSPSFKKRNKIIRINLAIKGKIPHWLEAFGFEFMDILRFSKEVLFLTKKLWVKNICRVEELQTWLNPQGREQKNNMGKVFAKCVFRDREKAQQLRVNIALEDNLSSILSICIEPLTAAYLKLQEDLAPSSGLHRHLDSCAQTHVRTHRLSKACGSCGWKASHPSSQSPGFF